MNCRKKKRNLRQRAGGGRRYPIVESRYGGGETFNAAWSGDVAFAMGFANYVEHLPYFRDEVLPRLEAQEALTSGINVKSLQRGS